MGYQPMPVCDQRHGLVAHATKDMPPDEPNLHRNNAAEWAMWVVLWPAWRVMKWMKAEPK